MHASRSAVDALLKDLGAEPLFSSINDPAPGIPVSLNEQNNYSPSSVPYNNFNTVQSDFSEAFISLLQRINQQNTQNIQNIQNQQSIQNSPQNFGNQGIQQQQQQNLNLNQLNLSNSNQVGLPNPISILNEMHQRNRGSGIPPQYSFTIDPNTGYFYCQLEVFGKVFKTERPTVRKQQAKEEAALMALRNLVNDNNSSDGNRRAIGSDIMRLYEPSFGNNYSENRADIISKSESWYKKQLSDFPGKQPRVILLEFCQMHRLPNPTFQPLNDYNGHTYFECRVGDRYFKSDKSFIKSSEAKDYVANIAFNVLFREMCEKEKRNDGGQIDARSILNLIENHLTSNPNQNINSSNSNISSPHSNFSSPHSNISNISNPHSHMNSPHSDVKLNIGSSHLNVTNSYSNFNNPPNPSHLTNSSGHNPQSGITNSHLSLGSLHPGANNLHSGISNPHSNVTNPHNSHSIVTNSHNPYSSVTSPHNPQSSITNPHLNMSNPHSNVNNSHLFMGNSHSNVDSSLATNITSPHSSHLNSSHLNSSHLNSSHLNSSHLNSSHLNSSHLNSSHLNSSHLNSSHLNSSHLNVSNPHMNTNNPHLNEITTSLMLPNYSHEISNIKVEETNPLTSPNMDMSNIKSEERDQLQPNNSVSSPISYHPYRTVGRERFPQNPSYNSTTQFAKKNTGFCKKFTSLLYEMSQSKRWTPPEFNFENGINGFICVCSIQDYLFKGKACSRKADAKESAAEEAYRFLARTHRG